MAKSNRPRRRSVPHFGPLETFAPYMAPASRRVLERGIRRLRDRGRCDACGAPPSRFGIYGAGPRLSRALMTPSGETAIVPYALCEACFARPGTMDRYEDGLWGVVAMNADRSGLN